MIIEKPDGALAFVVNEGGGLQPQARMTMVLEGYSAPITAGNFAKNVMQKLYVGKTLTVDFTGILIGKGTAEGAIVVMPSVSPSFVHIYVCQFDRLSIHPFIDSFIQSVIHSKFMRDTLGSPS